MFWDKVASIYWIFELFNGQVGKKLCQEVNGHIESSDVVLECACGTGMLSKGVAQKCHKLFATDFFEKMLKQAQKKCSGFSNIVFQRADITNLDFKEGTFDKVIAGNVIHLLDDPIVGLNELMRVCKSGGQVIVPIYVNSENSGKPSAISKVFAKMGAGFKQEFTYLTYQDLFTKAGFIDVEYTLIDGKTPCAVAVITKK